MVQEDRISRNGSSRMRARTLVQINAYSKSDIPVLTDFIKLVKREKRKQTKYFNGILQIEILCALR